MTLDSRGDVSAKIKLNLQAVLASESYKELGWQLTLALPIHLLKPVYLNDLMRYVKDAQINLLV